jgi:hypothetical protein
MGDNRKIWNTNCSLAFRIPDDEQTEKTVILSNCVMLILFSRVRTCGAWVPRPHSLGTEEAMLCCLLSGRHRIKSGLFTTLYEPWTPFRQIYITLYLPSDSVSLLSALVNHSLHFPEWFKTAPVTINLCGYYVPLLGRYVKIGHIFLN